MRYLCSLGLVLLAGAACAASPAWQTSTVYDDYGKLDRVPLPWTPVQVADRTLRVWGRECRWTAQSLLPTSVTSQGVELLRRPITLVVTLDGKPRQVPLELFRVTERRATRVSFVAKGRAEGLVFRVDGWVEYDGFLWLNLYAPAGGKVEALRIEAAMDPPQTTLYQAFDRRKAGWIGEQPIAFPWVADRENNVVDFYHWFGNEDRGLGFTYTSLQHWQPRSEDAIAVLTPGSQATIYTINLIEDPADLRGRSFFFGLQATPIKPLPPDYHSLLADTLYLDDWRACRQLADNMDMTVIWPLETGIMKGLNDPCGVDATRMAAAVQQAHDAGLPLMTIAACPQKVSAQVPELAEYRTEWQVLPESALDWDGQPQLQNCGKSLSLRKWLFHGWTAENVARFGTDGIYFDGWQAGQIACQNAAHGCGWTDAQGKRHSTVPVLEGREFNQRMVLWLEDHCQARLPAGRLLPPGFPRYHYWIHSWEFVPSVMGFATEWLTGEFAGWPLEGPAMLTPEGTYGKCVGLGLFRARCLSTNWGVPNLFDTLMWEHERDQPVNKQTLMAYAWLLPHGVSPALVSYMNHRTVVELTRLMQAFGTRTARFVPGWRPNPWWAIEAPVRREVMVATWDHGPGRPVLAVVSNLEVEQQQTVTLRWKRPAVPVVTDARTGEPVGLTDGRTRVTLGPESFVLLRAE
ncbi:MAG: hypothetical protein HPY69_02685 [Armatimonadetes bacterium]|nr:hypothetical protein [Armatimonadota bacterium]